MRRRREISTGGSTAGMTHWSRRTAGSRSRRWRRGLPACLWMRSGPATCTAPAPPPGRSMCPGGWSCTRIPTCGRSTWDAGRTAPGARCARQRGSGSSSSTTATPRGSPPAARAWGTWGPGQSAPSGASPENTPARPWLCSATALLSASSWPMSRGSRRKSGTPCHTRTTPP